MSEFLSNPVESSVESDVKAGLSNESSFFTDHQAVLDAIAVVCGTNWEKCGEQGYELLAKLLSKYQEQPLILAPYIEEMVDPLMQLLLVSINFVSESNNADSNILMSSFRHLHLVCKSLQLIMSVRGFKHVSRFFPHEVSQLEGCLYLLQLQDKADHDTWQTRYVLLRWLRVLCLIPFDICTVDSSFEFADSLSADTPGMKKMESKSKIVLVIKALCQVFLTDPGPIREAASSCLSSLLTRPDMETVILREYIAWSATAIASWLSKGKEAENELTLESFRLLGTLSCLAEIFKTGHREKLLSYAPVVLGPVLILHSQPNQTKMRKLLTKLSQRIGMTFLPPKVAKWRYHRGNRSLLSNLSGKSSSMDAHESGVPEKRGEGGGDQEGNTEDDVPDDIEEVIEVLLCSLQDKDTVVRWSAAKGIGRISMRLPQALADDVLCAVLLLFEDKQNDAAWHGGCLCLAELACRGLLLPDRLTDVVPFICEGIHFDLIRGQHSVGSHVRDAACYACWAFARAYSPSVMSAYVKDLSESMLLTAVYDREINCRRAASAAFQENVGRQGNENFPLGIEIITVADYFSLGNRAMAYTTIAPALAKMADWYFEPFVRFLVTRKVIHWDKDIRILASKGLAELTKMKPDLVQAYLRDLIPTCFGFSLPSRHGATLAIAEIVLATYLSGAQLPGDLATEVVNIISTFDSKRLYRGRGGEMLREAACLLIENIARVKIDLSVKVQVSLVEALNDNLKQPHESVQNASAHALRYILDAYFPVTDRPSDRLKALTVERYTSALKEAENVAVTRGFTLALGALPLKLLLLERDTLSEVCGILKTMTNVDHKIAGEPDAETRRNALQSMIHLYERLTPHCQGEVAEYLSRSCLDALYSASNDYSVDKRGDIGSWSRSAALKGMECVIFGSERKAAYQVTCESGSVVRGKKCDDLELRVGECVFTSDGEATVVEPPQGTVITVKLTSSWEAGDGVGKVLSSSVLLAPWEYSSERVSTSRFVLASDRELLFQFLLKQMAEKLDAIREVAGNVLENLLRRGNPDSIPEGKLLRDIFLSKDEGSHGELRAWGQPSFVFPKLVEVLKRSSLYYHSILSGLIISVGCVTETIFKESSRALSGWCAGMTTSGDTGGILLLASCLVKIMEENAKTSRIILPLLKTLDHLYKSGVFTDSLEDADLQVRILSHLKSEMNGCGDVPKLIACINVLLHLFARTGRVRYFAFKSLLMLLGHKYPRIRKFTAEQLYISIISDTDFQGRVVADGADACENHKRCSFVSSETTIEGVTKVLTETAWDSPISVCRQKRTDICSLLGIDLGIKKKEVVQAAVEKEDELDSYAALVREAGY